MKTRSHLHLVLVAVMVLVNLTAGTASGATVTQSITYQGKLTDTAGNPLTGFYPVTFSLYDVPGGGAALAADIHTVTAATGLFTTQLMFSQDLFNGRALWLGIKVGSDPEMTPRQEIRPVPYALSLRPAAWIINTDSTNTLNVLNRVGGSALNISTAGMNSPGVFAVTKGSGSNAVYGISNADGTAAVAGVANGANSYGLYGRTSKTGSAAVYGSTEGSGSPGVDAFTYGDHSNGVNVSTTGSHSPGVYAQTTGSLSNPIFGISNGIGSYAVKGVANGDGAGGVYAFAYGDTSEGVFAWSNGDFSYGIYARAQGANSNGAYIRSDQASGIWVQTDRDDHKYGVQTPDIIRALGYETGASDVAEYMPVTGDVVPGTVLIIGADMTLEESSTAYDTRVAGILSTAPGVSLGAKEGGNPGEELIAISGRVPCRVDATRAPIHAGDLLSTADIPGHAMKAQPVDVGGVTIYRPGTIIGKAMESLESGTGTIEVLVTLQ